MSFADYFDRRSGRFASFYRSRAVSRMMGRGALFERLDFAVAKITELGAQRVLDIGCGSGPLFAPLAARGIHVTGVEPAPQMVALAEAAAADLGDRIEIVTMGWEDIRGWHTGERFDVAVALGVFDYVPNPEDLLATMGAVADHSIASFPKPGLRTNLRKVRYGARGVSVFGYSRDRVEALTKDTGMDTSELVPLGRAGYALLAANHQPDGVHDGDSPAPAPVVQP